MTQEDVGQCDAADQSKALIKPHIQSTDEDSITNANPMEETPGAFTRSESSKVLGDSQMKQSEFKVSLEELCRARQELEASRARYLDLYDLAPVGYFTLSEEGMILETNRTFAALLGRTREDLVRQLLSHFIIPEDQEVYYRHRQQLFDTGVPQGCDVRLLRSDTTHFWARVEASLVQDGLRGSTFCHAIISDITDRKLAEKKIQESEEKYRNLIETIKMGYVVIDGKGSVIDANQEYLQLTGREKLEDLVGHSVLEWTARHNIMHNRMEIQKCIERMSTPNLEIDYITPSGQLIPVEMNANMFSAPGPLRILCLCRNISERKMALVEREKLESQNRQLQKSESLGRMAGAIAHHFNNQLQAVMGNLECALRDLSQGKNPTECLINAMKAARRGVEVSSSMLTYLGMTVGKREPLDLSDVCNRSLPLLRASIPKDVVLEIDWPTPGPIVLSNTNQIQQVLINLTLNACEASHEGSDAIRLTIKMVSAPENLEVNRFPIDWRPKDPSYACLEVGDSGSGIAYTDIEKIFDPFYSSKFIGRGLGLPVVLGIVRTHGGAISIESELGRGSAFRVLLPVTKESVSRGPFLEAGIQQMIGSGTLLVVEDEETVRKTTSQTLQRMGFTVLTADDGLEAVETFQRHRDKIVGVLCNFTMPRMGGWETLAVLRKLVPGIPVIMVTGHPESQVMVGKHAEMPHAFLYKPYDTEQLVKAISRALPK